MDVGESDEEEDGLPMRSGLGLMKSSDEPIQPVPPDERRPSDESERYDQSAGLQHERMSQQPTSVRPDVPMTPFSSFASPLPTGLPSAASTRFWARDTLPAIPVVIEGLEGMSRQNSILSTHDRNTWQSAISLRRNASQRTSSAPSVGAASTLLSLMDGYDAEEDEEGVPPLPEWATTPRSCPPSSAQSRESFPANSEGQREPEARAVEQSSVASGSGLAPTSSQAAEKQKEGAEKEKAEEGPKAATPQPQPAKANLDASPSKRPNVVLPVGSSVKARQAAYERILAEKAGTFPSSSSPDLGKSRAISFNTRKKRDLVTKQREVTAPSENDVGVWRGQVQAATASGSEGGQALEVAQPTRAVTPKIVTEAVEPEAAARVIQAEPKGASSSRSGSPQPVVLLGPAPPGSRIRAASPAGNGLLAPPRGPSPSSESADSGSGAESSGGEGTGVRTLRDRRVSSRAQKLEASGKPLDLNLNLAVLIIPEPGARGLGHKARRAAREERKRQKAARAKEKVRSDEAVLDDANLAISASRASAALALISDQMGGDEQSIPRSLQPGASPADFRWQEPRPAPVPPPRQEQIPPPSVKAYTPTLGSEDPAISGPIPLHSDAASAFQAAFDAAGAQRGIKPIKPPTALPVELPFQRAINPGFVMPGAAPAGPPQLAPQMSSPRQPPPVLHAPQPQPSIRVRPAIHEQTSPQHGRFQVGDYSKEDEADVSWQSDTTGPREELHIPRAPASGATTGRELQIPSEMDQSHLLELSPPGRSQWDDDDSPTVDGKGHFRSKFSLRRFPLPRNNSAPHLPRFPRSETAPSAAIAKAEPKTLSAHPSMSRGLYSVRNASPAPKPAPALVSVFRSGSGSGSGSESQLSPSNWQSQSVEDLPRLGRAAGLASARGLTIRGPDVVRHPGDSKSGHSHSRTGSASGMRSLTAPEERRTQDDHSMLSPLPPVPRPWVGGSPYTGLESQSAAPYESVENLADAEPRAGRNSGLKVNAKYLQQRGRPGHQRDSSVESFNSFGTSPNSPTSIASKGSRHMGGGGGGSQQSGLAYMQSNASNESAASSLRLQHGPEGSSQKKRPQSNNIGILGRPRSNTAGSSGTGRTSTGGRSESPSSGSVQISWSNRSPEGQGTHWGSRGRTESPDRRGAPAPSVRSDDRLSLAPSSGQAPSRPSRPTTPNSGYGLEPVAMTLRDEDVDFEETIT